MAEDMKGWALKYADMGIAVLPIKPPRLGGTTPGKEPYISKWQHKASTDRKQIEDWWSRWPDANIGIATGSISGGLVVIDLDIDKDKGIDGYESLKEWEKENGNLPETCQSITGRGGYHLLYRDTAGRRTRAGLYEGVDIRGEGGYIVAPPSLHQNGRRYTWEQEPGEYSITQADSKVIEFLQGPASDPLERPGFKLPEVVPEGQRVSMLVRLIGSQKGKGLGDEAIRAAVTAENRRLCMPPLTDSELEKEVFPALKRDWKVERPYIAVPDNGGYRKVKNHSLDMVDMDSADEEEPEWLIRGHIPKYQITTMVGDGGSGKTTVWCSLVAAISNGKRPFLLGAPGGLDMDEDEPKKVLFFSAEDSYKYTLRRKLRKGGANLKNIKTIDIADDRFQDIKFDSPFLEQLIDNHRPDLVVFDPVQAFVPPNIKMGERNAIRACLAPLIGYGEKYGCTFLIIVHTNKIAGAWGRKRMADSADMWDISRSVEMVGETNEKGIRYISQEKSNYGRLMPTVLFSMEDETVVYRGMSDRKDKDFVSEATYTTKQGPQKDEAKEFILNFLEDGEKEVAELDEMAAVMSISKNALKSAKTELRQEGKTKTWSIGFKPKRFYISLTNSSELNEYEEK